MQKRGKALVTMPTKKELGPILGGAGIFVICTYASIHQFIYPRSEAQSAILELNRRIDSIEESQKLDRMETLHALREIRTYIVKKK